MPHYLHSINFYNQFVNVDFDALAQPLANNSSIYQQHKNTYLKETMINMNEFNTCLDELETLCPYRVIDNKKHYFTYIDENKRKQTIQIGKNLIIKQTRLYNNFIDYITKTYIQQKKQPAQQKTFFSKVKRFLT